MKLITRAAFLALEGQVLYSKYHPQVFEGFEIKLGNCGTNDWVADHLDPGSVRVQGSEDLCNKLDAAETDPQFNLEMDFEYSGRDGCYDRDDSLIAVYDDTDIRMLIARLQQLLPEHNEETKNLSQLLAKAGGGMCSLRMAQAMDIMGVTTLEQFMDLTAKHILDTPGVGSAVSKEAIVMQNLIRRRLED